MGAGLNFDITIFRLKLAFEKRRVWAAGRGRKSGDVRSVSILSLLLRVAKAQTSNAHLIAGHFFQRVRLVCRDDIAIFDFIHPGA